MRLVGWIPVKNYFHVLSSYKNIYTRLNDSVGQAMHRSKRDKIQLILIMKFIFTTHKLNVQISFKQTAQADASANN